MVPAFMLQAALDEHVRDAGYLRLALLDRVRSAEVQRRFRRVEQVHWERFLDVDPSLHVVGHGEVFLFRLELQMVAVKVVKRHEDELLLEHPMLLKPRVRLHHGFCDVDATVNLLLSDSAELCAEIGQLGVEHGLDNSLEGGDDGVLASVNEHDRVIDNLLAIHFHRIAVAARVLEVEDAEVLEWGLVCEDAARCIQNVAEVGRGDAAVCKAL